MDEKQGKASTRAKRKYNEKAYDRVILNIRKGQKDELKAIAESCGESLNTFINKAIEKRIERERIAPNTETISAIEEVEKMIESEA